MESEDIENNNDDVKTDKEKDQIISQYVYSLADLNDKLLKIQGENDQF